MTIENYISDSGMIPEIETADSETIRLFQEEKLRETLRFVQEKSAFYQRYFRENQVDISEIRTLEDLHRLPFTTKDHLQRFNDDFLCVDQSEVIDYVTTSGTLGDPVIFALTDSDLNRLAYNEAISFACCGVTKNDVMQLMTTMDRRFMAGLAYFLGARKLGAGIVRVGSGIPELQWDSIQKFNPTYLITVPSFLLKLIEFAKQRKIDLNESSVKAAICIGEPIREEDFSPNILARKIARDWDIELFSTYASTEMSTAFNECEHHCGGHHHPELILAEVLDEQGAEAAEGEVGELVITTFGVEGMPLIRFKTGDMVRSYRGRCECGRNTLRLGAVVGRKKQMIKYKGTTLYPPAMYNILNDFEEVRNYLIEISHNDLGTDEIVIFIDSGKENDQLLHRIKDYFRAKLRVAPTLEFTTSEAIEKMSFSPLKRKPVNLIDRRKEV